MACEFDFHKKEKLIQAICSRPDDKTDNTRGITAADVSRVFPGARVVSQEAAKALTGGAAPERTQQQLRLFLGGKTGK